MNDNGGLRPRDAASRICRLGARPRSLEQRTHLTAVRTMSCPQQPGGGASRCHAKGVGILRVTSMTPRVKQETEIQEVLVPQDQVLTA